MLQKKLLETIEELNASYISVWEDVCNLESPTADKAGVDAVGSYFVDLARQRGWEVEVLELANAGNPVCITINPSAEKEAVVFSGHIDTVHPVGLFGTPAVRKDDHKIYGPGVMDCKGGVVASFMALDALDRCGFRDRPVKLIIQTDEETGSKTSGKKTVEFMMEKAKGAAAFLNTEGIDGTKAVLIRKGILRYRLNVHGKAVHSARCVTGANAIAEAAHKILKLEELKDNAGLTCNCGVISGGTVANTVAAECSFLADIRFVDPADCERAREIIRQVAAENRIPGCTCDAEEVSHRPSMPLRQINEKLLEDMNRIYEENGLPRLTGGMSLSGSDAAYATEAGIPCVDNLGVDGGRIHSAEEFGLMSSLAESAKRLALVACCL